MTGEASHVQVPGAGGNSVALINSGVNADLKLLPRAVLVGRERLQSFRGWVPMWVQPAGRIVFGCWLWGA